MKRLILTSILLSVIFSAQAKDFNGKIIIKGEITTETINTDFFKEKDLHKEKFKLFTITTVDVKDRLTQNKVGINNIITYF